MQLGGGMGIGSIALMLLGTQWYILFNVIAGAIAIPSDLKEVATLFHFGTVQRWKTVILPGIFPFLSLDWLRPRAERGTPVSSQSTSPSKDKFSRRPASAPSSAKPRTLAGSQSCCSPPSSWL